MRRRGDPRAGFMLIEALVALGLGALILVALLSLTGLLRRSADRAAAALETVEVSTRTLDTIAREIRAAVPRRFAATAEEKAAARAAAGPAQGGRQSGRSVNTAAEQRPPASSTRTAANRVGEEQDGAGRNQPEGEGATVNAGAENRRPFVFTGAPDRLLFALNPRQPTGLRAPVVVVWQIDDAGALLRAEAPLPVTATGPDGVRLGPVARIDPGPERLRFAFVDRQPSGDEIVTDLWSEPTRLPAAIRIERIDPRSGASLGMLRVPMLVDAEPGCVDPGKGACARAGGAAGAAASAGGADGRDGEPDAAMSSGQGR